MYLVLFQPTFEVFGDEVLCVLESVRNFWEVEPANSDDFLA